MTELFKDVLQQNEKIIATYKSNKKVFLTSTLLIGLFVMSVFVFMFTYIVMAGIIKSTAYFWLYALIIDLIFFVLYIALVIIYYNNLFYAYTNQRVIIRKGIIGIDYKSLDLATIGAIEINVGILDKLLKQNTGTISLGNMSSPLQGNQNPHIFMFSHIEKPYNVYKIIKTEIDASKK